MENVEIYYANKRYHGSYALQYHRSVAIGLQESTIFFPLTAVQAIITVNNFSQNFTRGATTWEHFWSYCTYCTHNNIDTKIFHPFFYINSNLHLTSTAFLGVQSSNSCTTCPCNIYTVVSI